MKKLNEYFFGEEEIHLSDSVWFYGGLVGAIVWTISLVISTW